MWGLIGLEYVKAEEEAIRKFDRKVAMERIMLNSKGKKYEI